MKTFIQYLKEHNISESIHNAAEVHITIPVPAAKPTQPQS